MFLIVFLQKDHQTLIFPTLLFNLRSFAYFDDRILAILLQMSKLYAASINIT